MRVIILCLAAVLVMALAVACAPPKAAIDYSMSERIVWPGPPEQPRIQYLWSLHRIAGGEGSGKFIRTLAGAGDYGGTDPQHSEVLIAPHGVFVNSKEMLYIADPGAQRVTVVNLADMRSFNITSAGGMSLLSPIGVVGAPDGKIYVSDSDLAKVSIFNENGKFVKFLDGDFKRPTGLAINETEGLLYVADTWEHKIYIYGLDGTRRGSFGKRGGEEGSLNYPTHIATDASGRIYVSDTLNFRVQIFSSSGEFINSFGLLGDSFATFDKIKGIAVDTEGHIYIVDSKQDMVKIYNREGELLLFFGQNGPRLGEFSLPTGIYIDGQNRIYVADSLNMRLQVFQFLGSN